MAGTEDDLKQLAQEAFRCLEDQWPTYDNYWQLGNAFDTVLDYFLLGPEFAPYAQGFARLATDSYERTGMGPNSNACWYDDFGWWGIAALKASQHEELFIDDPEDFAKFAQMAEYCWEMMHNNAPNVWENNKNTPSFKDLQPRFDGGVWNDDWSRRNGCGKIVGPPRLPSQCSQDNSQAGNLAGIQNTVTNGLYLVLAARLGQWDAARREYAFLNNWFNVSDPKQSLLQTCQKGVLVRERVSTYGVQGNEGYLQVCGYDDTLAWAGDQGIILGGALGMTLIGNADDTAPMFLQLAQEIVEGVRTSSPGDILQPWVTGNGGDFPDYSAGIGVFMRYLLYAYQSNNLMRHYLADSGIADFISANAATITSDTIQQHSKGWDVASNQPINPIVGLTNDLATLVAAIAKVGT